MNQIQARDKFALRRCRAEKDELRRLTDELDEMAGVILKAQALDGMPKSPNAGGGLDLLVSRRDSMQERLTRQEKRVRSAEGRAREALDRINPSALCRAFLLRYYVECQSMRQSCRECRIDQRQGYRYKREVDRNE